MEKTQKIILGLVAAGAVVGIILVAKGGGDPGATHDDAGGAASTSSSSSGETAQGTTPLPTLVPPPSSGAPTASARVTETDAAPIDLGQAALEATKVSAAQAALDKGDYRTAVKLIEEWERLPEHNVLTVPATMVKLNALPHVNRRTDALALAMETRDDPRFKDYHEQIEAIMTDAGLSKPPASTPAP